MLPPFQPVPLRDRSSVIALQYGCVDVQDGALVLVDKAGVRVQIPAGTITTILLEPGTTITHAAVKILAQVGTLLLWVGEGGTRLYSAGEVGGARTDRLLHQVRLWADPAKQLEVVRQMFRLRFKDEPPENRSVDQLRGIEGSRVRRVYQVLAQRYKVTWGGRAYDTEQWGAADLPNQCISTATACLYAITEAAVLTAGYSPALGFLHTGRPRAFVYDIADLVKFETVVPLGFRICAQIERQSRGDDVSRLVRHACRDLFRREETLEKLIPLIEQVLGEVPA